MSDYGPSNGIIGNDAFGTELPQTQLPEDAMAEVQNTAKFSKTKEFQELKEYLQTRMDFYKTYLPDGRPIISQDVELAQQMWIPANIIIGEFQAVIDVYENAAQQVKDAAKK